MPETIVCELAVSLGSGARWTSTRVIEVEATDVIRVGVAGGATDMKVEIQPGKDVKLLLIRPDLPSSDLSYATSAGAGATAHVLDEPHLLSGSGAVGLLGGAAPPTSLFFTNGGTEDAGVTVVVGRDATP